MKEYGRDHKKERKERHVPKPFIPEEEPALYAWREDFYDDEFEGVLGEPAYLDLYDDFEGELDLGWGSIHDRDSTWEDEKDKMNHHYTTNRMENADADTDAEDASDIEFGTCPLFRYYNTRFSDYNWGQEYGDKGTIVNFGFRTYLDRISMLAGQCGVRLLVTSAYRNSETGSKWSNHRIGWAIDVNVYGTDGRLCGWNCLMPANLGRAPPGVNCFI